MCLVEGKQLGDVVVECLEKDCAEAHCSLFWMMVEVKRKIVGKIEELVLPRRNKNLHDCMRLNDNCQLDSAQ